MNSRKLREWRRRLLMRYRRIRYGYRLVSPTAYIADGCRIKPDIEMSDHSFINFECVITSKVKMGRYALLGPRVSIIGDNHRIDVPGRPIIFSGMPEPKVTIIEDDVWVGQGSTIISGVRLGRGSIVAAGSIVTKDVPPFEIHGGVPNKFIRSRFDSPDDLVRHNEMLDGPVVSGSFNLPRSTSLDESREEQA
ncbi:MAG: DapH/DapD/GlmU-related protein [Planctomycetota bacterium]